MKSGCAHHTIFPYFLTFQFIYREQTVPLASTKTFLLRFVNLNCDKWNFWIFPIAFFILTFCIMCTLASPSLVPLQISSTKVVKQMFFVLVNGTVCHRSYYEGWHLHVGSQLIYAARSLQNLNRWMKKCPQCIGQSLIKVEDFLQNGQWEKFSNVRLLVLCCTFLFFYERENCVTNIATATFMIRYSHVYIRSSQIVRKSVYFKWGIREKLLSLKLYL